MGAIGMRYQFGTGWRDGSGRQPAETAAAN
jgi:hypothetical protein